MRRWENFAVWLVILGARLSGCDLVPIPFAKGDEEFRDHLLVDWRDLAALVAQRLAHWCPTGGGVNQLNLAAPGFDLLVGKNPNIGGNPGVVEKLFRECDDGFQPIVLQYPATDFGLAAACLASEQR